MIGKRLRLVRMNSGLSLRELEKRLGKLVTESALGKYERGEMMPTTKVLTALAETLGVTERFLSSQCDIEMERAAYRPGNALKKRDEAQVESMTLSFIERYLEIEELLNLKNRYWDAPRYCPFPISDLSETELAANALRNYWQVGKTPISYLAECFDTHGIKTVSLPLPDSVTGLTYWLRNKNDSLQVPMIIVNETHTGEWQRLALAEELGYLVLQVENHIDEEIAAERFAGAFLMPVEMLWEHIGTNRRQLSLGELFELKALFGTSVQSITDRCYDVGIINKVTYQRLLDQFEELDWLRTYNEPLPTPPDHSGRFKRLCLRGVSERLISKTTAVEWLDITEEQLTEEMEGIPA